MTVQPTRDQLRALADKATPGPWETWDCMPTRPHDFAVVLFGGERNLPAVYITDWCVAGPDAEFIAASRTAVPQLLDQLDAAEQRIRDLTQEVRDERGAALDQMEQVRIRDTRIRAVEDVLEEPDAMIGTRPHVTVDRIRRALEG